jgi:outer membrane immunogenic protein
MGVLSVCSALTSAFAGTETYSGKEMKQVAPAPPECDYTWTGFYIGGNAGYGWGNADTDVDPLPDPVTFVNLRPTRLEPDPNGFIGGGQVGFNWQWNKWLVLGAEADFQGSDMQGSDTLSPIIQNDGTPWPFDHSFIHSNERTQWFGTVRGRIGFVPFCRLLIYGTGGLAYGNVDYSANTDFGFSSGFEKYQTDFTKTKVGWTAGAGTEYALSHHWSVKLEYLYYDLGDETRTVAANPTFPPFAVRYEWDTTAHIFRGGLNFKF